jgi:hypothetical protein
LKIMTPAWRILVIPWAAAIILLSCATQPKQADVQDTGKPDGSGSPDRQTKQGFVVTQELYRRTFDEVQDAIADLNALISAENYDGWRDYLTADYIAHTSSPDYLARASRSGVLQKSGTVLHTLKDYFENVVVRSRVQATLTDINFVDETHVKALTVIEGRPVILYYLVREDGRWKVGIWQTEQN